jgi:hypothetical protein
MATDFTAHGTPESVPPPDNPNTSSLKPFALHWIENVLMGSCPVCHKPTRCVECQVVWSEKRGGWMDGHGHQGMREVGSR